MTRWGSGHGWRLALAAGTAVVVGLAVLSNAWAFSGATGSPYATGDRPNSVVIADFNGDGKADMATANEGGGVSVLLGDGASDPGFTAAAGSPFPVAGTPYMVATGDFNSDGKPDLVVSGQDAGAVTVLLGNGTGGFAAPLGSPFAVSGQPYALVVADLNGDGNVDIATVDFGPPGVSVLLGNGAGAFSAAGNSPFAAGTDLEGLAAADVNGDGKADLVATSPYADEVSVFLNDGDPDPSFTASGPPFPAGSGARSSDVTIGDVNGDGNPDLVTANDYTGDISVLLGDGAAQPTFTASAAPIPTGGDSPRAVALGDVDADGHLDAVTVNQGTNDVSVLLGDGTGAFTLATSPYPTEGDASFSLAIGDMNRDGRIDLVTTNLFSNNVSVLLNPAPAAEPTTTTTEPVTTTTTEPVTTTTTEPVTTTTTEPVTTTTTEPVTTTTTEPATTTTTRKPTRRGTGLPGDPSGDRSGLPRTGDDSTAPLATVAIVLMGLGGLLLIARRRSSAR
jgi:LPXTG-motif cell wall-anchored protein